MIPLSYFLIAWVVLLGVFALIAGFTIMQMLKHGVPGVTTYASTLVFVAISAMVILGSGSYFLTVDWKQDVQIFSQDIARFFQSGEDPLIIETPLE